MKMWVLTSEYNEYDQHGGYFVTAWSTKPSVEEVAKVLGVTKKGAEHVWSGGGRENYEYQWYNLFEWEEGTLDGF